MWTHVTQNRIEWQGGNESFDSIKCEEFEQLSDYQILKMDCDPWL